MNILCLLFQVKVHWWLFKRPIQQRIQPSFKSQKLLKLKLWKKRRRADQRSNHLWLFYCIWSSFALVVFLLPKNLDFVYLDELVIWSAIKLLKLALLIQCRVIIRQDTYYVKMIISNKDSIQLGMKK